MIFRGGDSPPYRKPCGNRRVPRCAGLIFQHRRKLNETNGIWLYDTLLPDYLLAGDPDFHAGGIAPYQRYEYCGTRPPCAGDPGCGDHSCDQCTDGFGSPIPPIFGRWFGTGAIYDTGSLPPAHWSKKISNHNVTGPVAIGDYVGGTIEPFRKVIRVYNPAAFGIAQADVAAGVTASIPIWEIRDFGACQKKGWKAIQAVRQFHGMCGPRAAIWKAPSDGRQVDGAITCTVPQTYKNTPDTTKYLKLTVNATMSMTTRDDFGGFGTSHSYDGTFTCDIDPLSGVRTHGWDFSYTGNPAVVDGSGSGILYVNLTTAVSTYALKNLKTLIDDYWVPVGSGPYGPSTYAHPSTYTWTSHNEDFVDSGSYTTTRSGDYSLTCDFNSSFAGSGHLQEIATLPQYSQESYSDYSISVDDTSITINWSRYAKDWDGSAYSYRYQSSGVITITYSQAQTAAQVRQDLRDNLMPVWKLNDDSQLPWRTDGYGNVAPLVARREAPGNRGFDVMVPIVTALDGSKTAGDPNAGNTEAQDWDGTIIGAPKDAGFQGQFLFEWEWWKACVYVPISGDIQMWFYRQGSGGDVNFISGAMTGGDGNPLAILPTNATLFPVLDDIKNKPFGPWGMIGDQLLPLDHYNFTQARRSDAIWECKYAEIQDIWPSHNCARPAGEDRFAYDETLVYAVGTDLSSPSTGGTFTLLEEVSGATEILADTSGVWGGKAVGGFYNITQDAGTGVVTLGTKVFDLPTGWASRSFDDDYCFGKLRWPTYPGLLGRAKIAILEDMGGGVTKLKFQDSQRYYVTGDAFDLFDAHMGSLASATVTRVDDDYFTVPVDISTLAGCAWVIVHGVKWYFDNDTPKGDYATVEWEDDNRTNDERSRLDGAVDCDGAALTRPDANNGFTSFNQTQGCMPFSPCYPKVICYSPKVSTTGDFAEGDKFHNGVNCAIPDYHLEPEYGSRWSAQVMPVMDEPLWQAPHKPVYYVDPLTELEYTRGQIDWREDPGTCPDNFTDVGTGLLVVYYPQRPFVETRLTVPGGYGPAENETPTLPPGITLGWLSPVDHTGPDVIYPQSHVGFDADGLSVPAAIPAAAHEAQCNAAAGACRFASTYQKQVFCV